MIDNSQHDAARFSGCKRARQDIYSVTHLPRRCSTEEELHGFLKGGTIGGYATSWRTHVTKPRARFIKGPN